MLKVFRGCASYVVNHRVSHHVVGFLWFLVARVLTWWSRVKDLVFRRGKSELYVMYEEELKTCSTYQRWEEISSTLDHLDGVDVWKTTTTDADLFDADVIQRCLQDLLHAKAENNVFKIAFALRGDLRRNRGGIGNRRLFQKTRVGTKKLIEDYVNEIVRLVHLVADTDVGDMDLGAKLDYFWATRQSFGRSALLLSGGATLGIYHVGVVLELMDHNLLPRVIAGSSVGSLVASIICVHTDEEVRALLSPGGFDFEIFERLGPGSARRKLDRLIHKGVLMDVSKLEAWIRKQIGEYTFLEAFQRTKRILNITVTSTNEHEDPRLLNYLTTPNVLVWSAALASCAVPFVFEPIQLLSRNVAGYVEPWRPAQGRTWADGSLRADLPRQRLSELFNVNHFIVSQVNPYVVPFLFNEERSWSRLRKAVAKVEFLCISELTHRLNQLHRMGLLPSFFSKLRPLVSQTYVGDITIVPHFEVGDFARVLSNPTSEDVVRGTRVGRRSTWPHIAIIKNHCLIELALEEAVAKIRSKIKAAAMSGASGGGGPVPLMAPAAAPAVAGGSGGGVYAGDYPSGGGGGPSVHAYIAATLSPSSSRTSLSALAGDGLVDGSSEETGGGLRHRHTGAGGAGHTGGGRRGGSGEEEAGKVAERGPSLLENSPNTPPRNHSNHPYMTSPGQPPSPPQGKGTTAVSASAAAAAANMPRSISFATLSVGDT